MPRPQPTPGSRGPNVALVVVVAAVVLVVLVGGGVVALQARNLVNQVIPQRTIAVSVTDDNGNALGGATVEVQGASVWATTESTGVALINLGSLSPGIFTLVAADSGYINSGAQFSIPDSGNPAPVAIRMPWAPPLGTFVWQSKSTLYSVLEVTGGNPNFSVLGYEIEWHCFSETWSQNSVNVSLGRDQLTYDGQNVPMGPGTISASFVRDGKLPNVGQPAPAGTCVNGVNAW